MLTRRNVLLLCQLWFTRMERLFYSVGFTRMGFTRISNSYVNTNVSFLVANELPKYAVVTAGATQLVLVFAVRINLKIKVVMFCSMPMVRLDCLRKNNTCGRSKCIQGLVAQSWVSTNPGLKFNPMFWFLYFYTSVYLKTSGL